VSAGVRTRVEEAIAKLNYVPSAIARSLKGCATRTVGLIIPNTTNPYFFELASGVDDRCARSGYCVIFCNSDDDPAKQRRYLRMLQEKRIDGLVLVSAGDDTLLAQSLAGVCEPLVVVDRNVEGLTGDLVQIDHDRGAYMATRHLLELGHARIGCITGPVSTAVSAMRLHGFIRAMETSRIEIAPGAIVESDFSCTGGHQAAARLFDTVRPSAIFACNDMMGIGALRAAAERGILVPKDCSIIGFDDIEFSRYTYPALSTVGQSVRALGETAAQTLIDRIAGATSGPVSRHVTRPRLVLRESTAACTEATCDVLSTQP
jgi:LacI family transcriptional regulator